MRFLGHPLHTQVNHFPVALFPTGLAFDVVGRWSANPELTAAALYVWSVGYLGLLAAIATGLPELLRLAPGAARLGVRHGSAAATLLLLFGLAIWARLQNAPDLALAFALIGTACTLVTSWLGGQLVYAHGAGTATSAAAARTYTDGETDILEGGS